MGVKEYQQFPTSQILQRRPCRLFKQRKTNFFIKERNELSMVKALHTNLWVKSPRICS